ncbi:MAG: transposase [Nitrosomonadaceae bacterium]
MLFQLTKIPFLAVLASELQSQFGVTVCSRTIRGRLNERDYNSCKACKKPFVSEKNRIARLRWAREHLSWTVAQWKQVLWTDESPFVFRWNGNTRVWRKSHERYHRDCLAGTIKQDRRIMVWACFAAGGVGSFIRVRGILLKESYKQILIHHAVPSGKRILGRGFIFQQDNDPKHTAHIVKDYLSSKEAEGTLKVLSWPSQSPDINCIENLWSIVDQNCANRKPQNEDQLFQILRDAWRSLPSSTLNNLVESMPHRCQAVIDAHGYPTKY